MSILVTGNLGYVGTVLTDILIKKGYHVTGFDTNYYENLAPLYSTSKKVKQIIKDIRKTDKEDLRGIDAIIHLAALSNDPLGELSPQLTYDINYLATINLAKLAKKSGIQRFIYASSQSMYGISETNEELDEDNSKKNAITEYAKTKWEAEKKLKQLGTDNFTVTCFRPSTVFGASPKIRCDIVFNNFVACAYTSGRIQIKSDGTPWRPVIHVQDVCSAFIVGLEAPKKLIQNESFNVGTENGNYTVRDLAEAAQRVVPGSSLIFTGEHGKDTRTYKVSFKKILNLLKNYFKPQWDLDKGGKELVNFFKSVKFTKEDFCGRTCNRLPQLKFLLKHKRIDNNLYWTN